MFKNKTALHLAVMAVIAFSSNAMASGFALIEQNASGMGSAYSGGAASAEDASTVFYNPAGMSQLRGKQVVVAGSLINPSIKFSNTTSSGAVFQTAGGNGGEAGSPAVVPSAYFTMEFNPKTHFGFGFNAPFGLQTKYSEDWLGRFQAVKSKMQAINLNPSASYAVNDRVSVGGGISYQHLTGDLTSMVNYSAAASGALGNDLQGLTTIAGSDSAFGYNLGALLKINPSTRVGVAYRSKIKYNLNGTIAFAGVPTAIAASPLVVNGAISLPIKMPDSLSISGFRQINDKLEMTADATWTGWSALQQLKIDRTSGVNVLTIQENWKNTWRVSTGAGYRYNDKWKSRVGIAFDQTPVSDTYRTARIPDSDRTWLSVGGQYTLSSVSKIDFGYAHLFMKDASIADMQAAKGKGNLVGTYKSSVDMLSMQYAYSF
jgi:long-chain fatty acid transport protein